MYCNTCNNSDLDSARVIRTSKTRNNDIDILKPNQSPNTSFTKRNTAPLQQSYRYRNSKKRLSLWTILMSSITRPIRERLLRPTCVTFNQSAKTHDSSSSSKTSNATYSDGRVSIFQHCAVTLLYGEVGTSLRKSNSAKTARSTRVTVQILFSEQKYLKRI